MAAFSATRAAQLHRCGAATRHRSTQLRAVFPIHGMLCCPVSSYGSGCRSQTAGRDPVPQRAVLQGLNGPFVYVLGDSDKVTARNVGASDWQGTQWLIDGGLVPGDRQSWTGSRRWHPVARCVRLPPARKTTRP
jgi:hypothetical protein